MTPYQIQLIQDSWKLVLPIADQAGALFYGRLFEIAPSVRPMFSDDLSSQTKKLMGTLAVVVSRLHQLDTILDQVQKLGASHNKYGVTAEQYAPVGAALLWTLEQGLGDAWNEELAEAWATAYGILSSAMIEAAEQAVA
ncbi:MAG: globin family protein [Bacteroidota bacterium]